MSGDKRVAGGVWQVARKMFAGLSLSVVIFPLAKAANSFAGGDADALKTLSVSLRPIILEALPCPLYEKSENWGSTTPTLERIQWNHLRPHIVKEPKNDGPWRKTTVRSVNPESSLEFSLSGLTTEADDRLGFKAFIALTVHVEHEEEIWRKGVRLFHDTTEARVRIKANLDVETTMRLENNPKSFLPDTVFRLRVKKADVGYDNLVFEHLAGVGGTSARLFGEALRGTLKQWKPSIERELLAKANRAVVKAADTKEVRLSLSKLLSRQP